MLSCHGHFPTDRFCFPKFGREHRRTGETFKASKVLKGPTPKGLLDQLLFICGSIFVSLMVVHYFSAVAPDPTAKVPVPNTTSPESFPLTCFMGRGPAETGVDWCSLAI